MEKIIIDGTFEHPVGDKECTECWDEYPKECECGGLIHASFGDYNDEESFYLVTMCDKCGESE